MSSSASIKCLMIGQAGVGKSTFLSKFPNAKKQIQVALSTTSTPSKSKSTINNVNKTPLPSDEWKETYTIEFMNNRFETVRIDLDNCDISLDTCLHDASASKVSPSPSLVHSATGNGFNSEFSRTSVKRDDYDNETSSSLAPTTAVTVTSTGTATISAQQLSIPPISMLPTHSSKFIDISPYNVIVFCFSLDDAHSLELIKSKWEIELKKNRAQQHSFLIVGFKSDLVFQDVNVSCAHRFQFPW